MGLRNDIVNETVEYFVYRGEMNPSTTDIRLISNEVGESYVKDGLLTMGQWERISQDRTIKLVRAGLKKEEPRSFPKREHFEEERIHEYGTATPRYQRPEPRHYEPLGGRRGSSRRGKS